MMYWVVRLKLIVTVGHVSESKLIDIYCYTSYSQIFHSYGVRVELQNLGIFSALVWRDLYRAAPAITNLRLLIRWIAYSTLFYDKHRVVGTFANLGPNEIRILT